jgi:hypothetical protein
MLFLINSKSSILPSSRIFSTFLPYAELSLNSDGLPNTFPANIPLLQVPKYKFQGVSERRLGGPDSVHNPKLQNIHYEIYLIYILIAAMLSALRALYVFLF